MVAAVFEAKMTREQADRLAELMQEHGPTRPAVVLTAALLVAGEAVRLITIWQDRATIKANHDSSAVSRGTELMRKLGVEPELRDDDVLEFG